MKLTGHIITLLVLLIAPFSSAHLYAQADDSAFIEKFEIFFRFDRSDIDLTYHNNNQHLAAIRHYIANSHRIDSITIYSYASPEGVYEHNVKLSRERAQAARRILLDHSPDSTKISSDKIRICPLSENWPGLREQVVKRYWRHDRDRVLRILDNKKISDDTRKWRLSRLDEGYTWSFLQRIYMPDLRVSTWVCVAGKVIPPLPDMTRVASALQGGLVAPVTTRLEQEQFVAEEAPSQRELRKMADEASSQKELGKKAAQQEVTGEMDKSQRTILGLKTNLLLDAVTALNYAIEVPINKSFSLQYFQTTPWWNTKNNKYCLQFLTFGGEARWWFLPHTKPASEKRKQRDALVGHFLGLYGWGGKGDIQLNRTGCYQFDFWSAGLTYGYSLPVSKNLNMEFTLSVGYANIPYQHYTPTDDYQILIKDNNLAGTLHYIGPTKAEISLVIPIRAKIGKKGGDR